MKRLPSFIAAAALAATVASPIALAQKQGGTMVMAIQGTPRHLNPAVQSGTATGIPGTRSAPATDRKATG